jgi:hypothetical protein
VRTSCPIDASGYVEFLVCTAAPELGNSTKFGVEAYCGPITPARFVATLDNNAIHSLSSCTPVTDGAASMRLPRSVGRSDVVRVVVPMAA